MGIIGRIFGRKGGEEPEEPREEAAAPAPEPAGEAPRQEAPAPERKPGLLGRVKRAFSRKEKKPQPPAEEAPAEGEAPPPPPPTHTVPTGTQESLPGTEDLAPEAEEEPEKDYSDAPSSANIQIPGTWKMSTSKWTGVVKGTLTGSDVVTFLKYLDDGKEEAAVKMICDLFDQGSGFSDAVDIEESDYIVPSIM